MHRIADAVPFLIQVGGGLRECRLRRQRGRGLGRTRRDRDRGVARPRVPGQMVRHHGDRVVVSVDARGGKVSLAGWTETSDVDAADAVAELSERGVGRFLFTAIEVDGTMRGWRSSS
ncbi:MAG: HisA/HisF-related TIM barrel protein [Solirubrobacterales bacterium]